uniref:Putative salivary secreted protein n=1 Tax=Glossina morsitans morsitans TaxID=37546 RepID=D3TMB5_GLOMM
MVIIERCCAYLCVPLPVLLLVYAVSNTHFSIQFLPPMACVSTYIGDIGLLERLHSIRFQQTKKKKAKTFG